MDSTFEEQFGDEIREYIREWEEILQAHRRTELTKEEIENINRMVADGLLPF